MNTESCIKCGKENPEITQQFIVVKVETNSNTTYSRSYKTKTTETTVKETFIGTDACVVCEECVKRERKRDTIVDMIAMLVGAVIIALGVPYLFSIGIDDLNEAEKIVCRNALFIIFAALGVLAILLIMISRLRTETPFVIARLYKRRYGLKDYGIKYIPVQSGLYCRKKSEIPDLELFKKKSGLKTQLAERLFYQLIVPGTGGSLVR